ncbi:MAG: nucleotidyltransferase domain-containing protein [Deltaproteobacteria bacterium]|nr:nucleotidyltransferase domain-containing protein [Deltaproteobacteria bacterium]
MVDESIVIVVRNYLQALQRSGLAVHFGVVFGSQTTGKANEWSDIDLLVVSPHFDGQRNRDDIDLLWRLAARTDSRIEPIPCGERQWQADDSSAIVEVARREGERIDPEDVLRPEPPAHA